MTIIKINGGIKDFPISAVQPEMLELFEIASNHLPNIAKFEAHAAVFLGVESAMARFFTN